MSVTISEALQQAQEAINSGNYRAAVATCSRLVQQYPTYAAAHRLLGEAWLEQGQNSEAERAFAAALAGNPRHPWAYLGLGLIAEDRGAVDPALAFTQVAWELAPNVAQLREPVRRTAMRRYGADGRLQFTRAALAHLHANNGRLQRAAAEYRAALAELPDRIDLRLGYAEVLWRMGQDAEAAGICRDVLEQHPDAIQALVILADIEHRGGDERRAEGWRARARMIDPDGSVTEAMLAANPRADQEWLMVPRDAVPVVSDDAAVVPPDMPHIAPAPDFEYVPSRPDARAVNVAELRPIELEEFGAEPTAEAFAAGDDLLLEGFDEQPFDLADLGIPAGPAVAEDVEFGMADLAAELPAAEAPTGGADELDALVAALEGDVADALSRASGPAGSDAPAGDDPSANLPPDVTPAGYTTMLRELDAEGLAPFDELDRSVLVPDLSDDLLAAEVAALSEMPTPPQPAGPEELRALDALANDWDAIDREIESAVPWEVPRGYTDELRSLEGIGLEPFDIGDEPAAPASAPEPAPAIGVSASTEMPAPADAPASSPIDEAALEALVAEAPAPSETAGGPPVEAVVAEMAAEVAAPAPDDLEFADLQPFAPEDFESGPLDQQTKQFSFGPAPWDTAGREGAGRSVVPSDEDLEELLAIEEPPATPGSETVAEVAPGPAPERPLEPAPVPLPVEAQPFTTDELPTADLAAGWEPAASAWPQAQDELEAVYGSSLAATRALGGTEEPPATAELGGAGPSAPAGSPVPVQAEPEAGAVEPVALDTAAPIGEIRADAGVFERARAAKSELIEVGAITGNLELSAPEQADDVAAGAESAPEEAAAAVVGAGASRDVETLRSALAADPDDPELHWWLAEALYTRGDVSEALGEYRWIVRHAPDRMDAVAGVLHACLERQTEMELAHRMLADIYRRRGDSARASHHAAMALQTHRRARG